MITIHIEKSFGIIPDILIVKKNFPEDNQNTIYIVMSWEKELPKFNNACVLTSSEPLFLHCKNENINVIKIKKFQPLNEGDILLISKTSLHIVYSISETHNVLFLTSECNENCIMCPEPPRKDERDYFAIANKIIELATPPQRITITGGEPTLKQEKLYALLKSISIKWPQTKVTILSNAYLLTKKIAQKMKSFNPRISYGIPFHADIESIHDTITQTKGSHAQTIKGLLALSSLRGYVEIRILLMQQNINRIRETISYIIRNFPFVSAIVIMHLEPMGKAREVWENIYVDPAHYHSELTNIIREASLAGIPINLYNIQPCTLPKELQQHTKMSISDWKKMFIEDCNTCQLKHLCPGFFASQDDKKYRSTSISPVRIK